jgi:F-type H+-transporting ATPase subunit delta
MHNPRLASRYAKSLVDLAQEKGQLEAVHADMQVLQQIVKSNRDVVSLLKSPIIKPDKKQKILSAILEGKVSEITAVFIQLLVSKGREGNLPEIITEFGKQYNLIRNITKVKITTAVPIDEATLQTIKQKVEAGTDKQIALETSVQEDLIGGFVLETEDKLYDASILRDLRDIRKQFEKNIYIHNIR